MADKNYKLNMYKKGDVPLEESLSLFPQMLLLIVILVFISVVLFTYLNVDIDINNTETILLARALKYSPECLAIEPGIIDIEKLTEDRLRQCYTKDNVKYNVRILKANEEIKYIKTMNARDLANFKVCSTTPNVWCTTKYEKVLIKDTTPVTMEVEVIINE